MPKTSKIALLRANRGTNGLKVGGAVFHPFYANYPILLCIFAGENKIYSMNRIKEFLEIRGMSQTDLAHKLGKSFNMINLYATNKVQPPIPVLYEIAKILKVDVRELLVSSE